MTTESIAAPRMASASAALPNELPCCWMRPFIGTLLVRFIVPCWLLAGAIFKLVERNPNLLPLPVRDTVSWIYDMVGGALGMNNVEFLLFSMRSMIGIEIMMVGLMFFVPKLARMTAILILSLFCVVLLAEIWGVVQSRAFTEKGFSVLLKPCGCFGAWSPPSIVTFSIDAAMLVGVLVFKPGPMGRGLPAWPLSGVACVASVVVGVGLAFGTPEKTVAQPTQPEAATAAVAAQSPRSKDPAKPADVPAAPTAAAPWPPAPAKLERTYFISEKKVLGQRLDSLPLALQISRPMPDTINAGRWHLIFYRKDCDHCFEMMNKHFSGALPAPTLAIEIPDSTGKPYPMPCKSCGQHALPKGPDYVVAAPLLMTVVDGVIVGISKDVDKPGAIDAVLNAGKPGAKAVDGALVLEPPAATAQGAAPSQPAVAPSAAKPFPAPPAKLEAYYAPEFEKWTGKRFDEQAFALLTARPLPFDLNAGQVCVIYYRADCEHCEQLLADHFSKSVPCPTITIAIPDTDPANAFDMPCAECKLSSLPAGPTYVIGTPVLVMLKDGVVQSVLSGEAVEDPKAVEAILPKKAK